MAVRRLTEARGRSLTESAKAHITEKTVHVEVILAVGIIAIALKVVILELKDMDRLILLGITAIIFALALSYCFVMR